MLHQVCETAIGWQEVEIRSGSDPDVMYIVTLPPWDRVPDQCSCSCPSYQHRGHCRHQREAFEVICGWSAKGGKAQTSQQVMARVCPDCGGPTKLVI